MNQRSSPTRSPKAMRLAKWSLNGIEVLDVKKSYRFEQGFTLELYTSPDSQEARDAFVARHIGPDERDIAAMLAAVGARSLDHLIELAVPQAIRSARPLDLPSAVDEPTALAELRAMAERNEVTTPLIGMGYYGTAMPGVVLRRLMESPGWYTAYTPYQAEVSQGRLEALLNYQQMVVDLTGMELANASLLDEATAAAEAMAMARRVAKVPSSRFFVDRDTHPQTLAVIRTRARHLGIEVLEGEGAIAKYREGMLRNLYIAPQLLDLPEPRTDIWHPNDRSEPGYADEFIDSYAALWDRDAGALRILREAHEAAAPDIGRLIDLRARMAELQDQRYDPDHDARWRLLVQEEKALLGDPGAERSGA